MGRSVRRPEEVFQSRISLVGVVPPRERWSGRWLSSFGVLVTGERPRLRRADKAHPGDALELDQIERE